MPLPPPPASLPRSSHRFLLIADRNLAGAMRGRVQAAGLDVARLGRDLPNDASDRRVAAYAAAQNRILMTFDQGFAKPGHFDLRNSPGVIILPSPPRFGSKARRSASILRQQEVFAAALDHIVRRLAPAGMAPMQRRVVWYRNDGIRANIVLIGGKRVTTQERYVP